jgi:hypothetical protein
MARASVAPPASTRSAQRAGESPDAAGPFRLAAAESEWDALAFSNFADAPLFCRWIRGREPRHG